MRLWSLHPKYLDRLGLVALWREALLARKVLAGETRGYRHHPQLNRFRAHPDPLDAIAAYLVAVADEAENRAYHFDRSKIGRAPKGLALEVTSDQLQFEWAHLLEKLRGRAPELAHRHAAIPRPVAHPLFRVVPGPIAEWERGKGPGPSVE
jgi:hypothetical protein